MIIRTVGPQEKAAFDKVAPHPLQSWAWGEFRRATGVDVTRLGTFDDSGRLVQGMQITFHPIPVLGGHAGYFPKGHQPTEDMLLALKDLGRRQNAVFIKLEPNLQFPAGQTEYFKDVEKLLQANDAVPAQALFTPYSFVMDLTPSVEQLLENCKSKTRYNIRLAQKRGVQVVEDTSEQGMEEYIKLLEETTERQNFYAHNAQYFRTMWKTLGDSGMMRIIKGVYEGKTLTAWILFFFNGVGYYPYGASSREHKEVMASNLMMWEALQLAKANGCTSFDMWGALGPNPDPKDKWYGFHRFKEGYSAPLMQSLQTHDLQINPPMYKIFTLGNSLRWAYLRARSKFGR